MHKSIIDYTSFIHIDGRCTLQQFIEFLRKNHKPMIIGGTNPDPSKWYLRDLYQILLLQPLPNNNLYVFSLEISNGKWRVIRRKFTWETLINTLEEIKISLSKDRFARSYERVGSSFYHALRGLYVNTPAKQTVTYPRRGDTSTLLNDFLAAYTQVTGYTIPVPGK